MKYKVGDEVLVLKVIGNLFSRNKFCYIGTILEVFDDNESGHLYKVETPKGKYFLKSDELLKVINDK